MLNSGFELYCFKTYFFLNDTRYDGFFYQMKNGITLGMPYQIIKFEPTDWTTLSTMGVSIRVV